MGVGPQEYLDIIDKSLKNALNKALKGHFVGLKHTFKKKKLRIFLILFS